MMARISSERRHPHGPWVTRCQRHGFRAAPQEEKGAIGIAFLVWLFGGGLGLAILIFVLPKVF